MASGRPEQRTFSLKPTRELIIECLEDGLTAVSLVSINFSKAFNRMAHTTCLEELAKRRASTDSIWMVAAFLERRQMCMKVNGIFSKLRGVRGGSPQGTKVGNYLFTVTIEGIEEQGEAMMGRIPPEVSCTNLPKAAPARPIRPLAKPIERFRSCEFSTSTPTKVATSDGVLRYLDESGRGDEKDTITLELPPQLPPTWSEPPPWTDKYVDDESIH